jgi:hypothetical protein
VDDVNGADVFTRKQIISVGRTHPAQATITVVSLDIAPRIDKLHKQSGCSTFNKERSRNTNRLPKDFPKTRATPSIGWVTPNLLKSRQA